MKPSAKWQDPRHKLLWMFWSLIGQAVLLALSDTGAVCTAYIIVAQSVFEVRGLIVEPFPYGTPRCRVDEERNGVESGIERAVRTGSDDGLGRIRQRLDRDAVGRIIAGL